jgi:RNA polymerase sigma-70 factor, ECF subfamily
MGAQDAVARAVESPSGDAAELSAPPAVVPPFSEVYRRYFDFVWSSTRHLGVPSEGIDDVVQEVFIVIHAKLHTLQQPDSLRSWIYGVVRRTVSGYRRSHKSKGVGAQLDLLEEASGPAYSTPLEAAEQSAQMELLNSLLGELDEAKREIFILAELEELTMPEIAEALEIPVNTAYSRLRAARLAFEAGLARRAARPKEKGLR